MNRLTGVIAMLSIVGVGRAQAQNASPGRGKFEAMVVPGSWTRFSTTLRTSEPSVGSYDLGGALSYNLGRLIGIEGEIGTSLAIKQSPREAALLLEENTPSMFRKPAMSSSTRAATRSCRTAPAASGGSRSLNATSTSAGRTRF
jgi:hypothetical protein